MSPFGPHVPSTGPLPCRVAIVAEAPGSEESSALLPLVGPSGLELRRMLRTIGASLDETFRTNVFSRQPLGNNLAHYGLPTRCNADHLRDIHSVPLTLNPITYLNPQFLPELDRLYGELAATNPNVIIALGNTACWALGLGQGINNLRGTIHIGTVPGLPRPVKILPTYHPAAILRQWDQRVISLHDLQKAFAEADSPDFSFDNSTLWLAPSLEDIRDFNNIHMEGAKECAVDIETKRGQITCVSFAPNVDNSLVIPFWCEGDEPNYWDEQSEAIAWGWVKRWMERRDLVKVFQNGLYDVQYLQRVCRPRACTEDTMLMHHSLYSEMKKGLGFLGSVYTNTQSWKQMRTFKKEEALKRDD